jgi:hypothetical protein
MATSLLRAVLICGFTVLLVQCSSSPRVWTYNYENGKTSLLLQDQAVPPANIPEPVLRAIAAGNNIKDKPYRWGGGHRKIEDTGYDCSGTVSYVLHHAGLLNSPTTSDGLRHFGDKGEGEWITVYAKDGHAFIVVAGLRLDTSGSDGRDRGPRWTKHSRSLHGFRARHPEGL